MNIYVMKLIMKLRQMGNLGPDAKNYKIKCKLVFSQSDCSIQNLRLISNIHLNAPEPRRCEKQPQKEKSGPGVS